MDIIIKLLVNKKDYFYNLMYVKDKENFIYYKNCYDDINLMIKLCKRIEIHLKSG